MNRMKAHAMPSQVEQCKSAVELVVVVVLVVVVKTWGGASGRTRREKVCGCELGSGVGQT